MDIIARDLKHIWHPCAYMKDFETCPPLVINRANGSILYTDKGPIIDAQSSWWCKSLGHQHPHIIKALRAQLKRFEHVIAANTTHASLAKLGEELATITGKQHIAFASDGACAVEIALKLALHAKQIEGQSDRTHIISLKNSYHGETFATLSVSDMGIYKEPYEGYGLPCHFIETIPYINTPEDLLWDDASTTWDEIKKTLDPFGEKACALIVEPLVQGSGHMRCYSRDFLRRLTQWAKKHNIYVIADEIMTGIGRTGTWLAYDQVGIHPDLICLSKGLTGGAIPFSCVLLDDALYQHFYNDYGKGAAFLHSHTHSANALGACAALGTIEAIKAENILEKAKILGATMRDLMDNIAKITGKLGPVRGIGAIAACDFKNIPGDRIGYRFYQQALQKGALIRPLGDTLYWLPPLNMDQQTLVKLAEITLNSINAL